jgi:pimeloyl-ACP methyl ester carboxylesterase
MATVLLFHHLQGLTPGVVAFADALREAGHTVHTPDLFGGRTFASIEEGAAFTHLDDAPDVDALADAAAAELPADVVYLGFSFGVMPAQRLAQTRAGAAGAVLCESCVPVTGEWAFGPWPEGVLVQVHGMDADPFFAGEGDIEPPGSSCLGCGARSCSSIPGMPISSWTPRCRSTTRTPRRC